MGFIESTKENIVEPGLILLPPRFRTAEAVVLLLSIGQQESRFVHTSQLRGGPARGYYQFERGGGYAGVIHHRASKPYAKDLLDDFSLSEQDGFGFLATNPYLATAFARLLLYTDPKPLPDLGDTEGAWQYYVRTWRPGKPKPETWSDYYKLSLTAVNK